MLNMPANETEIDISRLLMLLLLTLLKLFSRPEQKNYIGEEEETL